MFLNNVKAIGIHIAAALVPILTFIASNGQIENNAPEVAVLYAVTCAHIFC